MKKIAVILFTFLCLATKATENVELVIASGMNYFSALAISSNNKYAAGAYINTITIWDVKTGRQIRNFAYSDQLTKICDSLWFDDNDKTLNVHLPSTNDYFKVEVSTGKSEFVQGPPMDWSNYKYTMSNYNKASIHLNSESKKDLIFVNPNGNGAIVYHKIKPEKTGSGLSINSFEVRLKLKNGKTISVDTTYMASFAFSSDGTHVVANQCVYNMQSGNRLSRIRTIPYTGQGIAFLPGTHIPITSTADGIRVWNFPHVRDISTDYWTDFHPDPTGKFLLCELYDSDTKTKRFVRMDLSTEKLSEVYSEGESASRVIHVDQKAERFTTSEMKARNNDYANIQYSSILRSTTSNKELQKIDKSLYAYFTPNKSKLICDTSNGVGRTFYNLDNKQRTQLSLENTETSTSINNVSRDHKYIFGNTSIFDSPDLLKQKIQAWDITTGKEVFNQTVKGVTTMSFETDPKQEKIVFFSSFGNTVYVGNIKTNEILYSLKGHSAYVTRTCFSDDGKRLLTASLDGTIRLWNLEDGKEIVALISTDKDNYAIVTPDQYYYSTKGAQKAIHFVKEMDIFPFEQFDLKYNRPDIILDRITASADPDLIRVYNLAYQKRLKRLNFTEEMLSGEFHLPEVAIINQDEIPQLTTHEKLTLSLKGVDTKHTLNRLIVRVNEVPLNGKNGFDLSTKHIKEFEQTIDISLSQGENKISISVLNEKGVESIAANTHVNYSPSQNRLPELHLITVGVSHYQNHDYDLTYAAKDAHDLLELYAQTDDSFSRVIRHELLDEQVSTNALNTFRNELENTHVDDVICLFYAGHGLLDNDLNYYLASNNVDFHAPEKNGIPYEYFEDLLDNIPARRKLILLDACHSGEIDKEEVTLAQTEIVEEGITFRAVGGNTVKHVGLDNSFELMKELFHDLRKSSGTAVISSAGGTEYAMEGDQWNNGVFTYCMLNGIKNGKADLNNDGKIMMSELSSFLREEVSNLTNGRQQPTNRAEVVDVDWQIW